MWRGRVKNGKMLQFVLMKASLSNLYVLFSWDPLQPLSESWLRLWFSPMWSPWQRAVRHAGARAGASLQSPLFRLSDRVYLNSHKLQYSSNNIHPVNGKKNLTFNMEIYKTVIKVRWENENSKYKKLIWCQIIKWTRYGFYWDYIYPVFEKF